MPDAEHLETCTNPDHIVIGTQTEKNMHKVFHWALEKLAQKGDEENFKGLQDAVVVVFGYSLF